MIDTLDGGAVPDESPLGDYRGAMFACSYSGTVGDLQVSPQL
jgi:hypothetical protein